ncbi:nucleoside-diphosphate-sugar epimerase [Streptosporangium album]|uniref:Nucleoside-diphosphate-sugar epimerase n=1 Tax=Streptosporangium album TaxID=47479 RepID=A0A7W7WC66_9ACTN|nr:NAD-dependent epimerase/dehydratase family protein [Streptosporangium album]MBB4940934.1 nucleoside-diphosphate-sugar epimerase [Streptosporangium album]
MAKICVTGASGKLGRAVVRDLLDHGYEVVATDVRPGPRTSECGCCWRI